MTSGHRSDRLRVAKDDYKFSRLVIEIATSDPFRMRRERKHHHEFFAEKLSRRTCSAALAPAWPCVLEAMGPIAAWVRPASAARRPLRTGWRFSMCPTARTWKTGRRRTTSDRRPAEDPRGTEGLQKRLHHPHRTDADKAARTGMAVAITLVLWPRSSPVHSLARPTAPTFAPCHVDQLCRVAHRAIKPGLPRSKSLRCQQHGRQLRLGL